MLLRHVAGVDAALHVIDTVMVSTSEYTLTPDGKPILQCPRWVTFHLLRKSYEITTKLAYKICAYKSINPKNFA